MMEYHYFIISENFVPYEMNISQQRILQRVSKSAKYRPTIIVGDFQGCNFLIELIKRNWDDDPQKRNSFTEIVEELSKQVIILQKKGNDVSNQPKKDVKMLLEMRLKRKQRENVKLKEKIKELNGIISKLQKGY